MIKKLIFYSVLIALGISLHGCIKLTSLKDFYVADNIKISSKQTDRLQNYFYGEFYSYDIERNVDAHPVAFLISKNGETSVILACESLANNCNVNVQIYQLIQKYSKQEKVEFKILALGNNLKTKNTKIANVVKKRKFIEISKREDLFFDKILTPSDSCDGDDC